MLCQQFSTFLRLVLNFDSYMSIIHNWVFEIMLHDIKYLMSSDQIVFYLYMIVYLLVRVRSKRMKEFFNYFDNHHGFVVT